MEKSTYVVVYILKSLKGETIEIFDENGDLVKKTDKVFLLSINGKLENVLADSRKEIENFAKEYIKHSKGKVNSIPILERMSGNYSDRHTLKNWWLKRGVYIDYYKLNSKIHFNVEERTASEGYNISIISNDFK